GPSTAVRAAGRAASSARAPSSLERDSSPAHASGTTAASTAASQPTRFPFLRSAFMGIHPPGVDDLDPQPRSSSLMLVLARVLASTCLTTTAQYSEWLPSAAGSEPDTTTLYGGT